jgi:hypothetical protein
MTTQVIVNQVHADISASLSHKDFYCRLRPGFLLRSVLAPWQGLEFSHQLNLKAELEQRLGWPICD